MIVLVGMGIDDHPGASDDAADRDPRWRVTPTKIVVSGILLIAIIVPLLSGSYSRVNPQLFGFPFFYWYQFVWVFLAAGCCYLSYVLLRREHRQYDRRNAAAGHPAGDGGPADGGTDTDPTGDGKGI